MSDKDLDGVDEFLSSEEEQHAWHRGIFKGLKIHNPKTLYDELNEYDSFQNWEEDEQHYEDTVMVATYTGKMAAYGLGLEYGPEAIEVVRTLL